MAGSPIFQQAVDPMTGTPHSDEVRQIVARTFQQLGAGDSPVRETLFVDRGQCIARTYSTDRFTATWILDEGIVQFHDADKNLLQTLDLSKRSEKQAA